MSKDIKLSPKYGVNPTIPVCFFCGEERNEIALLGRIGDGRKGEDIEAPRRMVLDYEPCDKCKEQMARGITMIGVVREDEVPDNRPPIISSNGENLYPTGSWCVVSESFIRDNIIDSELAENIVKSGKTVADHDLVASLCEQMKNMEE